MFVQRYEEEFDVYLEFSVIQLILHMILHNPSSCAAKNGSIEAPRGEKAQRMPCFNIAYYLWRIRKFRLTQKDFPSISILVKSIFSLHFCKWKKVKKFQMTIETVQTIHACQL